MKKTFMVLYLMAFTFSVMAQVGQVAVKIDFGTDKPAQIAQAKWVEGMTALTALQHCANIETKPVGDYIFVSDIEGVKNIPFEKVWYYEINGRKPRLLAFRQPVNIGDTIKWIYRADTCSERKEAVTIEIRFGNNNRPKQSYKLDWKEGLTVMEALQHFVPVSTYPHDKECIFVYSVDGVKSVAKESFWIYFINGEKAHKIAASQLLKKGDRIIWEFRLNNQRQDKPIYDE